MADEPTGQPAQVATPAEPVSTIPATPPAPETQPPTPAAPVGGGPTMEQVLSELNAAKERAARAEHEALYTRNLIEQLNQGRREPEKPEPEVDIPEFTDDEFLTSPGKTFTKAIRAVREIGKKEQEQTRMASYIDRAKNLFETGKANAAPKAGKIISGIENEVALEIQDGIINRQIDPEAANDPKLWASTAFAYRLVKLGEDIGSMGKYMSSMPQGMSAGHTETPTPGAPPKAAPVLTEEERTGARFFGVTDEQWIATKKAEGK